MSTLNQQHHQLVNHILMASNSLSHRRTDFIISLVLNIWLISSFFSLLFSLAICIIPLKTAVKIVLLKLDNSENETQCNNLLIM